MVEDEKVDAPEEKPAEAPAEEAPAEEVPAEKSAEAEAPVEKAAPTEGAFKKENNPVNPPNEPNMGTGGADLAQFEAVLTGLLAKVRAKKTELGTVSGSTKQSAPMVDKPNAHEKSAKMLDLIKRVESLETQVVKPKGLGVPADEKGVVEKKADLSKEPDVLSDAQKLVRLAAGC